MIEVAFATHGAMPEICDDDRLAADVLRSEGVGVVPAVWDDPGVEWARFAGVVIRSTWDYHHRPERYGAWLRAREADGTNLWNPAGAVLGNVNKRYLVDLAGRGVTVVPTEFVPAGNAGDGLRAVLEGRGWAEGVVKPAVSAGADGTWRTSPATADADEGRFLEQCRVQDMLVQPFVAEVATQGEWSLVFFAGRYSHAVLKRPAPGDFRVQAHRGGHAVAAEPSTGLVEQAREVLGMVEGPLLYARVDGVERDGRLVLMELEINEPYLFLGDGGPDAALRFARAIRGAISGGGWAGG